MLLCRYSAVNFLPPLSFSLRTSIKHLLFTNQNLGIRLKTLSSAANGSRYSSFFDDTLTSQQQDQIHLYVDTLLHWNQKMNLTAVTQAEEVMERHVEDSLAMLPPIRDSYALHCGGSVANLSVVDVGTGAGLPGLVLAIACPGWNVTLVESMKKRCAFLESAVGACGLLNIVVVRGRAEDIGQDVSFREKFDVAVARAVAEMRILAEYCLPLVRVGGLFVAAKGHDPEDEVRNAGRSIQLMGASVLQLCSVESHSPFGQRTAIICSKDHPTPRKYPREPGTPAKLPL